MGWCPFLYLSPFCSYASFVTWSPFGFSLAYFDSLSRFGVWFFPVAVTIPSRSHGIRPSSVSSLVAFRGCGLRSLRCIRIYGCFVSALVFSPQCIILSSLVGHSFSVPLPPLSLDACGSFSLDLRLIQI